MSRALTQERSRIPVPILLLGLLWIWGTIVFAFQLIRSPHLIHEIAFGVTSAMTVGIFMRWRWTFWMSVVLFALSTGNTLLALQHRGYAHTSPPIVLGGFLFGIGAIVLHQTGGCIQWFKFTPTKRLRVTFWLLVGFSIAAGQFIQPILRSFAR